MDWAGMVKWRRDTIRESARRPLTACPIDGFALKEVDGVLWCPLGNWRSDRN